MRLTALILVLLTSAAAMAGEPMKLATDGKAACVILTQPGATPAERHAAKDLALHLKQITGADFPVVAPDIAMSKSSSTMRYRSRFSR